MFCEKCQKKYEMEILYCPECGQKLTDEPENEINHYGYLFWKGDEGAFQKLYEVSERKVRHRIYARIPSTEVEDCMQNVYLKIYRNIKQFDPQKGNFENWFMTIVRNETYNYGRSLRLQAEKDIPIIDTDEEEIVLIDKNPVPEEQMDRKETARLLQEILRELSEEQRTCLLLYFLEEMTLKEIAKELQISEGTVKSRLHYGKEKVREKVLNLEKQGTKLYGIAPLPFFVWLLRGEYVSFGEPLPFESIMLSIQKGAIEAGGATVSQKATGMQGAVAEKGAAVAKGAASGFKAAIGHGIGSKIIAGLLVASVISGGSYAGIKYQQAKDNKEAVQSIQDKDGKTSSGGTEIKEEKGLSIDEAYGEVLQTYRELCEGKPLDTDVMSAEESGLADSEMVKLDEQGILRTHEYGFEMPMLFYTRYDVNKDGVEDLLISSNVNIAHMILSNPDEGVIDAVWTYDGEKAIPVFQSDPDYSQDLCKDGTICNHRYIEENSNEKEFHYYDFSKDGKLIKSGEFVGNPDAIGKEKEFVKLDSWKSLFWREKGEKQIYDSSVEKFLTAVKENWDGEECYYNELFGLMNAKYQDENKEKLRVDSFEYFFLPMRVNGYRPLAIIGNDDTLHPGMIYELFYVDQDKTVQSELFGQDDTRPYYAGRYFDDGVQIMKYFQYDGKYWLTVMGYAEVFDGTFQPFYEGEFYQNYDDTDEEYQYHEIDSLKESEFRESATKEEVQTYIDYYQEKYKEVETFSLSDW